MISSTIRVEKLYYVMDVMKDKILWTPFDIVA